MRIPWLFGFFIISLLEWTNAIKLPSIITPGCKPIENTSMMMKLKRHLFCEYDSTVRPTTNQQEVTNVTLELVPRFLEFNDWSSAMTLHSWMALNWKDEHLTWNPSNFDGITSLHISSDEIWVPDLSVYNSGDMSLEQNGVPSTKCLLINTGSVMCIPALSYVTKCITDFTFWPYDKHVCRIRFGSWSHTGEEINFHFDKKGYEMDGYVNNTEWSLKISSATKTVKKFDCCPNDTFPVLIYTFLVERQSGLVHVTVVTPAITMVVLTLTVLWLDSRSTERIAMAAINFICHFLCLFDLHWQVPHNGENVPHILLFYRDSLALAAFALILTALLRKLQNMNMETPSWVSSTITFVLNNRAGRFLILTDDESKTSTTGILANETEENSDLTKVSDGKKESSWRQFAAIVEWLSFIAVVLTYLISFTILVPSNQS
ncbi:PREDICTED: neuronal acetylcholine receptor subunit alpha-2-like [Polistes canadensis]|uniref:neuronal acetylcholine receptor subunit alpha-2-like n=1 Tax=Polistes canadensis TaxID=91411 RepID=UPI000718C892|nr:PREDICTED: neuronal acetylcholine receptor subunit alpha-2-like [Polistes canadensis]KAI4493718.1 hypothetical protein M0804_001894 [Polistes exclamans]